MTSKRNYFIDVLRLVFMSIIVLHHALPIYPSTRYFSVGYLAVEFFFILSGFFLAEQANTLSEKDIGSATWSYVKRKLTGFYAAFFICFVTGFVIREIFHQGYISSHFINRVIFGLGELALLQIWGYPVYCVTGVAWFLSGLVWAGMLLYPLRLKYENAFFYIIAPFGAVCLIGFMLRTSGNLGVPDAIYWNFVFKGLLRAIADMLVGCLAWVLCQYWKSMTWTRRGKIVGSSIEMLCYLLAVYICVFMTKPALSAIIVPCLAMAISFSMSGGSLWGRLSAGKCCSNISLALLFSHFYWVTIVENSFYDRTWQVRFLVYLALTCITCAVNLYLIAKWKKYKTVILKGISNLCWSSSLHRECLKKN